MNRSRWIIASVLVGALVLGLAVLWAKDRERATKADHVESTSIPEGATLVGQWQTSPGGMTVLCDGMSEPIKSDGSSKSATWSIVHEGSTGRFVATTDSGCKLELVGDSRSLRLDKAVDCSETQGSGQVKMAFQVFEMGLTSDSRATLRMEGTTVATARAKTMRCRITGSSSAEKVAQ